MIDQLWGVLSPTLAYGAAAIPGAGAAIFKNMVSLDTLSSLAGLSAALSLSYAALPNFRHRTRVQEHVRNKVRDEELVAVLAVESDLCNQESWAILYRLGKLRDVRQAAGLFHNDAARGAEIDHNFQKRLAYFFFNHIYASNFDKIAAALLGCIASTVIWFGAMDNIYYHDLPSDDPSRIAFFARVQAFYLIVILLSFIAVVIHNVLWHWDMSFRSWRSIIIHILGWFSAIAFTLFLIGASTEVKWFDMIIATTSADGNIAGVFVLVETILAASIFTPLLLLAIGEILTRLMLIESDRCIVLLVAELDTRAATVKIKPPGRPVRGR